MGMGIGGITLSTSLVTLFNACVLGALIYKKVKMDYKGLFTNLFKMCVAGVITLGICYGVAVGFDKYIHLSKVLFEMVKIGTVAVVCFGVYTVLNLVFKMEYARELNDRLLNKLNRKS